MLILYLITHIIYSMEMADENNLRVKGQRKPSVSATISKELYDRLEARAEKMGTYISNVVENAIKEHLNRLDKEEKKK